MKKFYTHNGENQNGPFNIEELKAINITKDTPIWYEGIANWTTADKVEELKSILPSSVVPPKFEMPNKANIASTPPQFSKTENNKENNNLNTNNYNPNVTNKESNLKRNIIIGACCIIGIVIIGLFAMNSQQNNNVYSGETSGAIDSTTLVQDANYDNSAEIERQNANAALTQKNMTYRNNYEKYLTLSRSGYQSRTIGGIYNLEITFTNNTEYVMDVVNVQVGYIQENGQYYKTETLQFTNVQPNSQETLPAPDSERGLSVDYQFTEIYSKKMHFYYPSHSGNDADPYFYK